MILVWWESTESKLVYNGYLGWDLGVCDDILNGGWSKYE